MNVQNICVGRGSGANTEHCIFGGITIHIVSASVSKNSCHQWRGSSAIAQQQSDKAHLTYISVTAGSCFLFVYRFIMSGKLSEREKKKRDETNVKILQELLALPDNQGCADCGERGKSRICHCVNRQALPTWHYRTPMGVSELGSLSV